VELSPESWDAYSNHGCLCDSAWKVGLAANETQEPEWFGPNCARRHCPSGDDPVTIHVVNHYLLSFALMTGLRLLSLLGRQCWFVSWPIQDSYLAP